MTLVEIKQAQERKKKIKEDPENWGRMRCEEQRMEVRGLGAISVYTDNSPAQ